MPEKKAKSGKDAEYKKNEEYTGVVQALGTQGEGVVPLGEATFFVPRTLPGERARFKVLKLSRGIGYGKAVEILTPSPDRVSPRCAVFGKCGGCQLQHMTYAAQLAFKRDVVQSALKKIGNIEYPVPMPVSSDKEYGYRNKLQLPVASDGQGGFLMGFYAERSHRVVPTDDCAIHPDWAKAVVAAFGGYMRENGVAGYDEKTGTGSVRHLVVRDMGGKFIVTVVSRERKLKNVPDLISRLQSALSEFTLLLNVNDKDTNVIFGDKFYTLYGTGVFDAVEQGVTYEAGAQTFVQVNADVRGKLYEGALAALERTGAEVVADCYSGAGLLTAMIARRVQKVYGIELSAEAVQCADRLKERNGLKNMENICGKVEEKLAAVLAREKGKRMAIVLDPPRAGIDRSVLGALVASRVRDLVLISCNPATLARDLGILTGTLREEAGGVLTKGDGNGAYRIRSLQPFDMFPQTKHVETLVFLEKRSINNFDI